MEPAASPNLNLAQQFTARAVLVGDRIDVRALGDLERLATSPLTVAVPGGGAAVVFRYGAVVFFGVSASHQDDFLARLQPHVAQPHEQPETEEIAVRVVPHSREGPETDVVLLHDADVERLQVVADPLSKSVVLAWYESKVTAHFERIEPLASDLERRGRFGHQVNLVVRDIGATLLSEHRMVGRVQMADKPELVWDRPDLERLYLRLEDEFEIHDRYSALERKLSLISRTARTVLELLQHRSTLRVEWYIVILIVMEIFLTLYQMYVGTH